MRFKSAEQMGQPVPEDEQPLPDRISELAMATEQGDLDALRDLYREYPVTRLHQRVEMFNGQSSQTGNYSDEHMKVAREILDERAAEVAERGLDSESEE
tara:strand:+ start:229 stop:525 length:297 start_codon:yes stop_codon:yes gene_type:complete